MYRDAAVLVPSVDRPSGLHALFIQRTHGPDAHSGQVAFPGGKIEHHDPGPVEAALREAEEETGVSQDFVEVLGFLDFYRTGTRFRIAPVVGIVREGFTLVPDPIEVADIFEVPLAFLIGSFQSPDRQQGLEGQGAVLLCHALWRALYLGGDGGYSAQHVRTPV